MITDHLVSLVVEEARTLETIDVDLMMLAFGGQFVETVVTNAVLQTRVGLVKGAKVLLGNDENIGYVIVVDASFIDIDDIYCFGTGLPISMSKDVYQYRYFK